MGKRELLIILAFAAIGAVVYQLSAPPTAPGARGFSWTNLVGSMRRGVAANAATAKHERHDTIELSSATLELRVSGIGAVTIVGEARADIGYSMTTEAFGPDAAVAAAAAERAGLRVEDLGSVMAVAPLPAEGRQQVEVTIRVPSRLAVRIDGSRRADVHDVAALQLESVSGDVIVGRVRGAVTGAHRNGRLTVDSAGSVDASLSSSTATIAGVDGRLALVVRSGSVDVARTAGDVVLDMTNADAKLSSRGAIRIGGTGGSTTIDRPNQAVTVDARRMRILLTLSEPVPVNVFTTDALLTLVLDGPPPVEIDARSDGGEVRATDIQANVAGAAMTSTFAHRFGTTAKVALRNQREPIVISFGK